MSPRLSVDGLLADIASAGPTGGGGAAAALTAAAAAALVGMVAAVAARHTAQGSGLGEVVAEAEALRGRLTALIEMDVEAYRRVIEARRGHDVGREHAVREALVGAIEVPLEVAGAALRVLGRAVTLMDEARPSTRADVAVAGVLAAAALEAAAVTARANLESLDDRAFVAAARGRVDGLLREGAALRARLATPLVAGSA